MHVYENITDAGGPRNISQLEVLKHVMQKACLSNMSHPDDLVERPYELFDVIGGVGTGGSVETTYQGIWLTDHV